MIHNILNQAIKENELIGVRTYDLEYDEIIIGKVLQIKENYFELNELDENLFWVGKTIIYFDDVMELVYKDRYQQRLMFLLKELDKIKTGRQVMINAKGERLKNYLSNLKNSKEVITFFFNDEHYETGLLKDFDNNFLYIKNIGQEGDEDGWTCFRIDDLIGIRYNGFNELKIKTLHKKFNLK